MKIVIGLGNPGKDYQYTRHNVGFLCLDHLMKDLETISCSSKFDAKICEVHLPKQDGGSEKIFFVYPETYMNNSGHAVKQILDFYKLTEKDILVLHDEVDLPLGTIKFTEGAGSAGHNGVQSIIDAVGTSVFKRIRIGIETREDKTQIPTEAFVLQIFPPNELDLIPFDEIKTRVLFELK